MGRVAPLVCALALAASNLPAQRPSCDICRRAIEGEYTVWKDNAGRRYDICQVCRAHAPRCALCSMPTKNRPVSNGDHLCDACRRVAVGCMVCRELVRGSYTEYTLENGVRHRVCADCRRDGPRCAACETPFARRELSGARGGAELWCRHCLAGAEHCELCLEPVRGVSYRLQFTDGLWCAACFEGSEKCYYCQRPMKARARTAHAGYGMCADCAEQSLSGSEVYAAIARQTEPLLEEALTRPLDLPAVEAVTLGQLKLALANAREGALHGFLDPAVPEVAHELGLFLAQGQSRRILILDALPEDTAWETIAHEMAHAWQFQHYPQATDPLIVEGFAQWVAAEMCRQTEKRSGLERLYRRADDYGFGLRLIDRIDAELGRGAVFKVLQDNAFPAGFGPTPAPR